MKKYDVVFWDIDGTLLDFLAAERWSLERCLAEVGVSPMTEEMLQEYSAINVQYWKKLELGLLTREEILVGRYRDFFEKEGIQADPAAVNEEYQRKLGQVAFPMENSLELCRKLRGVVKQYGATNGTAVAQNGKLAVSGLDHILDGCFISEEVGANKPSREYFEEVFRRIPEKDRSRMMVVGDSLTSDIKGGVNAGITTVWYNPKGKANDTEIRPDYEIRHLEELLPIIGV